MGIFKRIFTIIKAYVNQWLNRVEDPQKLLDQSLQDMEENLRRAKVDLARAIADEKRLNKQLESNTSQAEQWQAKAVLAVKSGNDELAREALKRKQSYDALVKDFEGHWKSQKDAVDALKESLRVLQNKIEEAKRKRNLLVSRQQRALLQQKVHEAIQSASALDPSSTLSKMEEKISTLEAESAALESLENDSLEERFKSLEASSGVENELAALKEKHLSE